VKTEDLSIPQVLILKTLLRR